MTSTLRVVAPQVRITEEFAFLNGSTLYAAMLAGGGGSRAPGRNIMGLMPRQFPCVDAA